MDATDLTDEQLKYLREAFEALLEGWRSDFRLEWNKTHGDLVNQLAAMIWAMHRDKILTMHPLKDEQQPPTRAERED